MEIIRIPKVSLVDATSKSIGLYSDDPGWWQQLKNKQLLDDDLKITEDNSINETGSKSLLIKKEEIKEIKKTKNSKEKDKKIECTIIGETPLHIAIMYNDFVTIKNLLENKYIEVNQRSLDPKFSPGFSSKQTSSMISQSKYGGLAYFGEYPLALAACFANKEIYDYLIEKGADPNMQDTYGNTVLHVLVINDKIDMFQYATNHPKKKALLTVRNNQDLTPINLAAKLARKDIFINILELQNLEFWRYSTITCSAYPLEGLDTIDFDGKIAPKSTLSLIVEGEDDEHLEMLYIGVVDRLLRDKWATYASNAFFKKLVVSCIHILFLMIAVYTRAGDDPYLAIWPPTSSNTIARYISEIAVVLGCILVEIIQAREIMAQGIKPYLENLIGEPANMLYQAFCILILVAVPFRFVTFTNNNGITAKSVEDCLVIIAIPCGWCHFLFYCRVTMLTGPFVVMIYKMITGDILNFSSIYGIFLFGFSLAYYHLYKNYDPNSPFMNNFLESVMATLMMSLGELNLKLLSMATFTTQEVQKIK